jgi:hypothetical protein
MNAGNSNVKDVTPGFKVHISPAPDEVGGVVWGKMPENRSPTPSPVLGRCAASQPVVITSADRERDKISSVDLDET